MAAKKTTVNKASAPVSTTPVRNTMMPPRPASPMGAKKSPPTYEQIARRAYEIWKSGKGGSQDDNWFRAERELRGS